jgi:hypothetical protein
MTGGRSPSASAGRTARNAADSSLTRGKYFFMKKDSGLSASLSSDVNDKSMLLCGGVG